MEVRRVDVAFDGAVRRQNTLIVLGEDREQNAADRVEHDEQNGELVVFRVVFRSLMTWKTRPLLVCQERGGAEGWGWLNLYLFWSERQPFSHHLIWSPFRPF